MKKSEYNTKLRDKLAGQAMGIFLEQGRTDFLGVAIESYIQADFMVNVRAGDFEESPFTPKETPWPIPRILSGDPIEGEYGKSRCLVRVGYTLEGYAWKGNAGTSCDLETGKVVSKDHHGISGVLGPVLTADGDQVLLPANGRTGFSILNKKGEWEHGFSNGSQIRGGAMMGDRLITSFFTGDNRLISHSLTDTKDAFSIKPTADCEFIGKQAHWALCSSPDAVVCVPWNSPRVGIYKPNEGVWRQIGPNLGTKGKKASSGAYDPDLGLVVILPREARYALTVDTKTEEVKKYDFSPELVGILNGASACFDSCLGPDGWVYGTCFGTDHMIRIFPATGEIQHMDISETLKKCIDPDLYLNNGYGFYMTARMIEGVMYWSLGGAKYGICFEFENGKNNSNGD